MLMEFGGKWACNSFTLPLFLHSCLLSVTSFLSSIFPLLHPPLPSSLLSYLFNYSFFTRSFPSPHPFLTPVFSCSLLSLNLPFPRLSRGLSLSPLKPVPRWGPRQLMAVMFALWWRCRKWCRQFVLQRVHLMHGWAWRWGLPKLIGCGCRGHRPRALHSCRA